MAITAIRSLPRPHPTLIHLSAQPAPWRGKRRSIAFNRLYFSTQGERKKLEPVAVEEKEEEKKEEKKEGEEKEEKKEENEKEGEKEEKKENSTKYNKLIVAGVYLVGGYLVVAGLTSLVLLFEYANEALGSRSFSPFLVFVLLPIFAIVFCYCVFGGLFWPLVLRKYIKDVTNYHPPSNRESYESCPDDDDDVTYV